MRRCASRGSIASATRASPPGTSMSTWCATTAFAGATPGPRRSCMAVDWRCLAARRGAHRRKRPRRPMAGMMLHQDASKHRWIPALEAGFDLVITLDDATSEIYSAFLVDEEGTASTFRALLEVFGRRGLPCSLYTDRGSHYFLTPKAGEKPDPRARTQVGR